MEKPCSRPKATPFLIEGQETDREACRPKAIPFLIEGQETHRDNRGPGDSRKGLLTGRIDLFLPIKWESGVRRSA